MPFHTVVILPDTNITYVKRVAVTAPLGLQKARQVHIIHPESQTFPPLPYSHRTLESKQESNPRNPDDKKNFRIELIISEGS